MSVLAFLFMDKMLLLYALFLPPMWVAFAFIIISSRHLKGGFDWRELFPFLFVLAASITGETGYLLVLLAFVVIAKELIYEPAYCIAGLCITSIVISTAPTVLLWWLDAYPTPYFNQYPIVLILMAYSLFSIHNSKEDMDAPNVLAFSNGLAPGFISPFLTPSNKAQVLSELGTFFLAVFIRPTGKSVISELMNTIAPVDSYDYTIFIGIVVGAITVSILTGMKVKIPEASSNAKLITAYISIVAIVATFIMNSTLGPHTIPVVIASIIVGYILACTKTKCFLSMVVFLSACGIGPS